MTDNDATFTKNCLVLKHDVFSGSLITGDLVVVSMISVLLGNQALLKML